MKPNFIVFIIIFSFAVVPITPLPIIASPAIVSLTAGAAVGWFTLSTNGSLHTGDSNTVKFALSGTDAGLYTLGGADVDVFVQVGMKKGGKQTKQRGRERNKKGRSETLVDPFFRHH